MKLPKLPEEITEKLRLDIGILPKTPITELDWLIEGNFWTVYVDGVKYTVEYLKNLDCYAIAKDQNTRYGMVQRTGE